MKEDDFEAFEQEIKDQENALTKSAILEGQVVDRELQAVIDNDDFFDEDLVKDGVYIPPLDTDSPKMRQVWGEQAAAAGAEFEPNTVCLDGEYTVVVESPVMIEHDKDTNK